jgi:hypothetical protein
MREKIKTNEQQKIRKKMSISLRRLIKGESMRLDNYEGNQILRYIFLSRTDLREYIEHQFVKGMNWDNYCTEWEIDHIAPASLFDLTKTDDIKLCYNYLNLMPLGRKDNVTKANSLLQSKIELEKRLKILPSNKVLNSIKEKVDKEEDMINTYNYDLEFLKFYNRINYH